MPYTELVNPVLTPLADEMEDGWEGCLSVPGFRGVVPRCTRLRYEGFDPARHARSRASVDGFHARVVQHECDHLDGILYPMRIARHAPVRLHRRAVSGHGRRTSADEVTAGASGPSSRPQTPRTAPSRAAAAPARRAAARRRSGTRPRRARPAC